MRIGLTGGIASGKSTVSRYLASLGMEIIDGDLLAREVLVLYPEILAYLKDTYGDLIFQEGELDRRAECRRRGAEADSKADDQGPGRRRRLD